MTIRLTLAALALAAGTAGAQQTTMQQPTTAHDSTHMGADSTHHGGSTAMKHKGKGKHAGAMRGKKAGHAAHDSTMTHDSTGAARPPR